MQRKRHVHFPTTNRKSKRTYVTVTQLEEHFGLLLLLLQHNFDKVVQRTKARRK